MTAGPSTSQGRSGDPRSSPGTTIEVLTPDFLKKDGALEVVVDARPVFNHNLETVPRPILRFGLAPATSIRCGFSTE